MIESQSKATPASMAASAANASAANASAANASVAVASSAGLNDLVELVRELAVLGSPATGCAELIDLIAGLEALKRAAAAAGVRLTYDLLGQRSAAVDSDGVRRLTGSSAAAVSVGAEVALARREPASRGNRLIGLAAALATEMPNTLAALTGGLISEWAATVVVKETAILSADDRQNVDASLAEHLGTCSEGRLGSLARAFGMSLDPESFARRASKAMTDRRVSCRPAPDTMTWLTALLPVADGVAARVALERAADAAQAKGDSRTRGQVMADTLVERLTGRSASQHRTEPEPEVGPEREAATSPKSERESGLEREARTSPKSERESGSEDGGDSERTECEAKSRRRAASAGESDQAARADECDQVASERVRGSGCHLQPEPEPKEKHQSQGQAAADDAEGSEREPEHAREPVPECATAYGGEPEPAGETRSRRDSHRALLDERPGEDGRVAEPGAPVVGPPVEISVNLVMSPEALFTADGPVGEPGGFDGVAWLEGEPIPAWLARDLVTDPNTTVRVRRLFTHPVSGQLVSMESRSRLFTGGLRDLVKARDQRCRGCGAPIRHVDHVRPHHAAGVTSFDNGQALCEFCNYLKEEPGWRHELTTDPSGIGGPPVIRTTTPTGHTYYSRAPVTLPAQRTRDSWLSREGA